MILAILQARVSSTRLPGKVLKPILGRPMLFRQIERVLRARRIDALVVASSRDKSDDPIEALCKVSDLACYRGNLDDVLDRFYQAANPYKPDHIVRLTGDCPLADPDLIDETIAFHLAGEFDYTSNALEPTYPDGLDIEVFRYSCLEKAWQEARLPSQREHVTSYIYSQGSNYKLGSMKQDTDLSHLRWTVDEPLDYQLITIIYEALYPINPEFSYPDILAWLHENPVMANMNLIHKRNEGYRKSLGKDRETLS